MQQYELCFIALKEDGPKIVEKILDDSGAKILHKQNIGRRKFAYPIKKEGAGFYVSIYFNLDNKKMNELNKNLLAEQEVLRFLIVKNDIDIKKLTETKTASKPKTAKRSELQKNEPTIIAKEDQKIKQETVKREKNAKVEKTAKKAKKIKPVLVKEETKEINNAGKKASADEAERIKKLEEKLDELLKE